MLFKFALGVLKARLYKPSSCTLTISRQRPPGLSAVYPHPTWSGEPKIVFPTNLLRLPRKGLSKLDVRISCSFWSLSLHSIVCLLPSLPHLEGRRALQVGKCCWVMWLRLCLCEVEKVNVELSFCQGTKLREPFGVSIEKWFHFVTGMLAATSRGCWVPLYPLVQSKLFLMFKKTEMKQKWKSHCISKP